MTHAHSTPADLLGSLYLSLLASEVPVVEAGKPPPEWIKVTPAGKVNARDGRTFNFDPSALADRFAADKVDVPVDLDHSTVLKASRGEQPSTVGYIPKMEARDDGTYARVQWNKAGLDALAAGTHRYVSPSMHLDAANNATWLHSIALTSAPALSMPAIAAALGLDRSTAPAQLAVVAGALNLPTTADEAAILAAIGGMVPKATHEATLALLTAATEKVHSLTATARKGEVDAELDKAMREFRITPAQRGDYLAMCSTEGGLATFRTLMAKTMPMLQPSGLDGRTPPRDDGPTAVQDIIDAARLHVAERAQIGIAVTMPEAINAVRKRA